MRTDMHKVFTRPQGRRSTDWKKYERKGARRRLASTPVEELPAFEGMSSRKGVGRRRLGHGPLRKFVVSCCGRPWAEVFSEFCRHNDMRSPTQRVLREALLRYVEEKVVLVEGIPYDTAGRYRIQQHWVHPQSGILMPEPIPERRKPSAEEKEEAWRRRKDLEQYPIDRDHRLVFLDMWDGTGWFVVTLRPLPEEEPVEYDNYPKDKTLGWFSSDWLWTRQALKERWGKYVYAAEKRPAKAKIVRRYARSKEKKSADRRLILREAALNQGL